MSKKLQIARECLRMAWQAMDAGGISMGRSEEAMWVELAMRLIESDGRYSDLADENRREFRQIAEDEARRLRIREMNAQDREMGYKVR